MSRRRILCPFHAEKTPSCMLYEDGYYCQGCGKHGPLSELKNVEISEIKDPDPEDLDASLSYVDRLPKRTIRGLELPADESSYYIVWPDRSYYKRRFFEDRRPKYIGAAGHYKGPFWARQGKSKTLILIEGEVNALSVAKACPEFDIMSPGGSGDFSQKRVKKYLKDMSYYDIILIIADADKAGALACIEMLGALKGGKQEVKHLLMSPDANEVLCEAGKETLRAQVTSALGSDLERRA